MTSPIRRVITGHDENGTAIVTMDSAAPNSRVRSASGLTSTLIWVEDETPADNEGDMDKADRESGVSPPDGGSLFRIVEFPPEQEGHSFSNEAMKQELGLDADNGTIVRHPGMHRTRSVDYAIVISGEIHMLLDESEVHLKAGDTIVQRGTNHAWANRGDAPCIIAFVLIDAKTL
ncbi:MAG: cupin domain-containing protein [Rhodospirillaceae bacterium]|jgi:mannose-6-phosphate isomerase-like protein (cupin superfamily)|nr:cupin domain-containing protein [Rhodospirillaceae bacterium]MBT5458868.1 cupin domain-containing protein [Rhodospirillaceae bacterium]